MSSPTRNPFQRIAIFMGERDCTVGGYRPGAYSPEGTFPDVHAALDHALTLPVADPQQPIHILRLEVSP